MKTQLPYEKNSTYFYIYKTCAKNISDRYLFSKNMLKCIFIFFNEIFSYFCLQINYIRVFIIPGKSSQA